MRTQGRWALVAATLVAVVAVTLLAWPRPTGAMEASGLAGPYQVRLLIETPTVGVRDVAVEVTGGPVERLVVAPTMAEMGHAVPPITATVMADGRHLASGVDFFMAGRWEITLIAHGPDGPADVVFPVVIGP